VITPSRIKKELLTLLILFLIGFIANIVAIIVYKTNFKEILTSLPYVVLFTLAVYLLWSFFRLLVGAIIFLFKR